MTSPPFRYQSSPTPSHYRHKGKDGVVFGEAHHFGTVVLSYEAVVKGLRNEEDGHNLHMAAVAWNALAWLDQWARQVEVSRDTRAPFHAIWCNVNEDTECNCGATGSGSEPEPQPASGQPPPAGKTPQG